MASWDPWDLLVDGECRHRGTAYFSICIANSQEILATCLASLCALLATTDPECVVTFVSRWVYAVARDVFVSNGVLPVLAPEWSPVAPDHPYAHLQGRSYSFTSFEAFRLSQHDKVIAFDIDILFMRNASGLAGVEPFSVSRIPKGRDPSKYINTGITVLRPSLGLYTELVDAWRSGRYGLHFADDHSAHQDVVQEVCVSRGRCGPVHDLDACVYNHGSWLPERFWRRCSRRSVVARHNFNASREPFLARLLEVAFRRGRCRARIGSEPDAGCWVGEDVFGEFARERCCATIPGGSPGGDVQCWGRGLSYERCCVGVDDSQVLRAELLHVGEAWYGLSSLPDSPSSNWLGQQCRRQHARMCNTLMSLSQLQNGLSSDDTWRPWADWRRPGRGPPRAALALGIKCVGMGDPDLAEGSPARFIVFRFRFREYLERHRGDLVVGRLRESYLSDRGLQMALETGTACVPAECCMKQPAGVNSTSAALQSVLWSLIVETRLGGLGVPAPLPEDFETIRLINPEDPFEEWRLCYREA